MCTDTGDAYRYTLQPIYLDVDRSFSCHLRPRPAPRILYQLWFYVMVPDTGFETDRVYAEVSPRDVQSLAGQVARHHVEFVTVDNEPAWGAGDGRDLVLEARRPRPAEEGAGWRYTTSAVTTNPRPSSSFHLQHVDDNVVVTATTFAEPFAHSTSTWVAGDTDQTTTRCYTLCHVIVPRRPRLFTRNSAITAAYCDTSVALFFLCQRSYITNTSPLAL